MDPAHLRTLSINSAVSTVLEQEEEQPVRCAKFRRQELSAFKPVWSPRSVAAMYFLVSLILIPLGVVIFTQSARLLETQLMRYDRKAACSAEALINSSNTNSGITPSQNCVIRFNITKKTRGPVFVYYGMVNFYQNSRRYARSRSINQLRGLSNPSTADCKPDPEVRGPSNDPIVPCGLTAVSRFNDTFQLCSANPCTEASTVNATSKNIAWAVDRNNLFRPNDNNTDAENAIITDENFMVWMRLSPYRTWFKLYKKILEPLEPQTYFMKIDSFYPVDEFGGEKFFYLAETTWFGGPNRFLGLSSIVIGGFSLIFSILYGVSSRFAPKMQLPPETKVYWNDSSTDMGGKESPRGSNNNNRRT